MKGLSDGHDPNLLDVTEMVKQAWEEVFERKLARCWLKADILPRGMLFPLEQIHGKVKGKKLDEENKQELQKVTQMIKRMKLNEDCEPPAPVMHSSDEVLESSLNEWIEIEESTVIQEAICNDAFDEYESDLRYDSVGSSDIADDQPSAVEGAERRIKSLSEIADAFKSVEAFTSDVNVPSASDAIRRAKRNLIRSYQGQKKLMTQRLMVDYALPKPNYKGRFCV